MIGSKHFWNDTTAAAARATRRASASAPQLDRLADDFRVFLAECEALFRNPRPFSGDGAAALRHEFAQKVDDARARLDAFRTAAGDGAGDLRKTAAAYVRRGPVMAVGLAALAGMIAAVLLSRR